MFFFLRFLSQIPNISMLAWMIFFFFILWPKKFNTDTIKCILISFGWLVMNEKWSDTILTLITSILTWIPGTTCQLTWKTSTESRWSTKITIVSTKLCCSQSDKCKKCRKWENLWKKIKKEEILNSIQSHGISLTFNPVAILSDFFN